MKLKDTILSYLDNPDIVLVFPTETVKRYYLTEYVASRKTSILADRSIAFDEFAKQFAPISKDKKPANKYIRTFFASYFLNEKADSLKYFYNPKYKESKARFIPFISSILPELKTLDKVKMEDENIKSDLKLIYDCYNEFLEKEKLFEPAFFTYDLKYYSGERSKKYYLVAYDAEINMQRFLEELNYPSFILPLSISINSNVRHKLFCNEKAELCYLFDNLSKLCKEGIKAEEIIISTPDIKSLKPYLEKEAMEYGIPLNFTSSVKLSETIAGRLFKDLKSIYDESLSFYSLERFLLNPSYPFEDRECAKSLVMALTENGLLKGSFTGDDRIEESFVKKKLFKQLNLYRVIKRGVQRLFESNEMTKNLHILLTSILVKGEFEQCDEEVRNSYAFAVKELFKFQSDLESLSIKVDAPFSSFISTMDTINYVSSERKSGIRVFSYSEDYLLTPLYHFVISLDDEDVKVSESDLNFLEDYEVVVRKSYDVTSALLNYYKVAGENVFLSSSRETYASSSNPPMLFLEEKIIDDAITLPEREISYATKQSLMKSEATPFSRLNRDEDIRYKKKFNICEIKVTYSALKDYIMCPYLSYLKKGVNIAYDNVTQFEPNTIDMAEAGNFLHNTIENFLTSHSGETLYSKNREEYKKELEEIFYSLLSTSPFDTFSREYIKNTFFDGVVNFTHNLFDTFGEGIAILGIEGKFEKKEEDVTYEGRYDIYLENSEGGVIIDLKSKKIDEILKTYQLPFYKMVINSAGDEKVNKTAYYSIQDSKFGLPKDSEQLENDIKTFVDGEREGLFNTNVSKECGKCNFRAVCRRRFNIQ